MSFGIRGSCCKVFTHSEMLFALHHTYFTHFCILCPFPVIWWSRDTLEYVYKDLRFCDRIIKRLGNCVCCKDTHTRYVQKPCHTRHSRLSLPPSHSMTSNTMKALKLTTGTIFPSRYRTKDHPLMLLLTTAAL